MTHTHTARRWRLGLGLLVLAGAGSMMPALLAQPGQPGSGNPFTGALQWNRVPLSECSACGEPPDDWGCEVLIEGCVRIDYEPEVVSPGIPSTIGSLLTCDNCGGCPDDPPSGSLTCDAGAGVQFTVTATASISAQITGSISGIQAALGGAVGVAIGTTRIETVNCSYQVPPCATVTLRASMDVLSGRSARMRHRWYSTGKWTDDVDGFDCDKTGQSYSMSCGDAYSTASADTVLLKHCQNLGEDQCEAVR